MTRESLNKHWKVIDAWRKGAEVEYLALKWEKIEDPGWFLETEYRIAPAPEYIYFDFTDAEFLIGKVIKSINGGYFFMITGCNSLKIYTGDVTYSYSDLFYDFTFLDGSPCGKLKQ
jgi:hypothetical protein